MAHTDISVVRKALDMLMECPSMPALELLDSAMKDCDSDLSFENDGPLSTLWGDHLDAPAPFAELVRRAFCPKLDPHAWAAMATDARTKTPEESALVADTEQRWQEAIAAFGRRYGLWGQAAELSTG